MLKPKYNKKIFTHLKIIFVQISITEVIESKIWQKNVLMWKDDIWDTLINQTIVAIGYGLLKKFWPMVWLKT